MKRSWTVFFSGLIAGFGALAFNFLLRLANITPYPPEAALNAFLTVVPASIEEPAVQQFGDFAGQLGLIIATIIAAVVYGLLAVAFDRFLARRLISKTVSKFESLIAFSFIPWLLFGLVLFPIAGASLFGQSSAFASPSGSWTFPLSLLLVQGVFILLFSPRYTLDASFVAGRPHRSQGREGDSRRDFLEKGAIGALAVIAAVIGISSLGALLTPQIEATGGSTAIDLNGAPAIFSDPRLQALVDSEVTTNGSFYRVAIDVLDPTVDVSGWSLAVDGLVASPKNYSLSDLQSLPSQAQYTTLECVSNTINGDLISNAKWTGVKLSDLLQDAGGAQQSASYVVFYSVDGYSVGIPLSKALMPDSMIAYSMNDQPLPVRHGFPLRGLIPGLYGMMSAKWVNRISLVDSTYQGFWQTRGWTNNAAVNTVAFIVSPQTGVELSLSKNNGSIIVAGYAFAGNRGIQKVEVSFDQGKTWQAAELKPALSGDTWALWAYEWTPPSTGSYGIYARATDGSGSLQTSQATDNFPNGATGYAYINVGVAS